jgi:hypothetical protein
MWVMDEYDVSHVPDRWDKCLDLIIAVILAMLYTRPPTIQKVLDALVVAQ